LIGVIALLAAAGAAIGLLGLGSATPSMPRSQEGASARPKHANDPTATRAAATAAPIPTTGKLRIAVMNTTGWGVDPIFTKIGVAWTRLDVGDGSDITMVRMALSHGMRPLVVYTSDSEWLDGVSPSTAAAQVAALAHRILPLGLDEIEFGNEVYNGETATTYAAQYAAAHAALAGTGVRLLAVATALRSGAAGQASPTWIPDFIHALPGGAAEVDAWTIHPYGPLTGPADTGGWEAVRDWHTIAVDAGSNAPWYVTEIGQRLDGSDAVTQAQQADDLTRYLDGLAQYPWVVFFDWYASKDDSSGQWGLLNGDNTPRLAFSALQTWMAANAAHVDG
jgi:hypothetical protein